MHISVVHCGSSHKLSASFVVWLQLIVLVAPRGHWDGVLHVSLCEPQMLQYLKKAVLYVFISISQSLTYAHMLSFCATRHNFYKPISLSLSVFPSFFLSLSPLPSLPLSASGTECSCISTSFRFILHVSEKPLHALLHTRSFKCFGWRRNKKWWVSNTALVFSL